MNFADPELEAMATVEAAIQELPEEAVARVLHWAAERHGVRIATRGVNPGSLPNEPDGPGDIAELFAGASLRTDPERALLAGYWFQHHQGSKSFTGQQINSELKQMGVGISNVTHALSRLIQQRPALVQQLSKSGKAKQARKHYRLTTMGVNAASALFDRGSTEGD